MAEIGKMDGFYGRWSICYCIREGRTQYSDSDFIWNNKVNVCEALAFVMGREQQVLWQIIWSIETQRNSWYSRIKGRWNAIKEFMTHIKSVCIFLRLNRNPSLGKQDAAQWIVFVRLEIRNQSVDAWLADTVVCAAHLRRTFFSRSPSPALVFFFFYCKWFAIISLYRQSRAARSRIASIIRLNAVHLVNGRHFEWFVR